MAPQTLAGGGQVRPGLSPPKSHRHHGKIYPPSRSSAAARIGGKAQVRPLHHGNGGRLAIEDYNRYKGKRRNVPGEDPVIRIRVERGRANIKRYGGKIQFTSQANYEGNQPIVRIPDSYAKRGKVTPGKPPVVPLPDRRATRAATECAPKGRRKSSSGSLTARWWASRSSTASRSSPATRPATKANNCTPQHRAELRPPLCVFARFRVFSKGGEYDIV